MAIGAWLVQMGRSTEEYSGTQRHRAQTGTEASRDTYRTRFSSARLMAPSTNCAINSVNLLSAVCHNPWGGFVAAGIALLSYVHFLSFYDLS